MKLLVDSKTPLERQNNIISSIKIGLEKKTFNKTLNNALYIMFSNHKNITDNEYLIFRKKVLKDSLIGI